MLHYNYKLSLWGQVNRNNAILRDFLMKKHDENLFQIGEVTKIMGVTRKALLVYEDMGLLTPGCEG